MDRLGLGVIVHCFNATTPAFVINIWVGSALILWISRFDNDCRHSRVILCSWLAVVKNTYLLPTPSKLWKELLPGHIMSLQVKLWYSNHFCHPVEGCQKDEGCEILHASYWRGSTVTNRKPYLEWQKKTSLLFIDDGFQMLDCVKKDSVANRSIVYKDVF